MNEFPFPPTRISSQWVIPVHLAFLLLVAASLAWLFWSARRPARGAHLLGCFALAGAALLLFAYNWSDETQRAWLRLYGFLVKLTTAITAVTTTVRLIRPQARIGRTFASSTVCVILVTIPFLLPSMGHPQSAYDNVDCKNRIKDIGLALLNYEEEHGHFPSPEIQPDGLPPRSWRVNMLPFLGATGLRRHYQDNETWDGISNRRLADSTLPAFRCPANRDGPIEIDGIRWQTADYLMVKGPHEFGAPTGRKMRDFPDGVTNTIAIVEATGRRIPWLKPEDVDPSQDTVGINLNGAAPRRSEGMMSSYHAGGAYVAMADGSVKFINEHVARETLQALLTADEADHPGEF